MEIRKKRIPNCEPFIDFEWLDRLRGRQFASVPASRVCELLEITPRTLDRRLKTGFSSVELRLLALFCCGRMDQLCDSWSGFRVDGGRMVTPFGKPLTASELEQYTFYMSIAENYKIELRKIKAVNDELESLLANYGESKVVELPVDRRKKSTA